MQQHVKRSITLSSDMDEAISEAVERGDYPSANEIVDEALRLWNEKRDNFGFTLAELQTLVAAGVDSGPGKYASMDEIKAEARRRLSREQSSQ